MINLAPKEIKHRQGQQSKVYLFLTGYTVGIIAIALGAIAITTYSYIAEVNLDDKQAQLDALTLQKQKYSGLAEKASFVDNRIQQSAKYKSGTDWDKVLGDIAGSTPQDTVLATVTATSDPTKAAIITVSGSTPARRSIVLFQDKLATAASFSGATIASVTEDETDGTKTYSFSISVTLKTK